jgi:hypothetical protein
MKILSCILTALMLVTTADAANNANDAAAKKKAEREKARSERTARLTAIKDFLAEKDANKDGSVKKDEYLAGETDQAAATAKFEEFDKNRDRSLSKSEIADMLGIE